MKLDIHDHPEHDHPEGAIPEISGDEVIPMLASEIGKEVAAALIDCKIFQGNSDQPATIVDCDLGSTVVAVRTPDGRARSFALRGAALLPTQSLTAAIDTYHGQRVKNEEPRRRAIREFGFEQEIANEDLDVLLAAIRSAGEGKTPTLETRARYMSVMSKYRSPNAFAAVAEAWLTGSDREVLSDVVVQLSAALRAAKRHTEAIALTDFVEGPCYILSRMQKQILLTSRAGAWLDEYLESGEAEALGEARRCVRLAEVIGPSDYLDRVKSRLDRQELSNPCHLVGGRR